MPCCCATLWLGHMACSWRRCWLPNDAALWLVHFDRDLTQQPICKMCMPYLYSWIDRNAYEKWCFIFTLFRWLLSVKKFLPTYRSAKIIKREQVFKSCDLRTFLCFFTVHSVHTITDNISRWIDGLVDSFQLEVEGSRQDYPKKFLAAVTFFHLLLLLLKHWTYKLHRRTKLPETKWLAYEPYRQNPMWLRSYCM